MLFYHVNQFIHTGLYRSVQSGVLGVSKVVVQYPYATELETGGVLEYELQGLRCNAGTSETFQDFCLGLETSRTEGYIGLEASRRSLCPCLVPPRRDAGSVPGLVQS